MYVSENRVRVKLAQVKSVWDPWSGLVAGMIALDRAVLCNKLDVFRYFNAEILPIIPLRLLMSSIIKNADFTAAK